MRMKSIELLDVSEESLELLAAIILRNRMVLPQKILLEGEVGTGKTTFSSKFINLLGTNLPFSSPTYSMVNEYDDIASLEMLYHFDLYRASIADYDWIFEKLDVEHAISLIEWASLHQELLEYPYISLTFEYVSAYLTNVVVMFPDDVIEQMKGELVDAGFIFKELH